MLLPSPVNPQPWRPHPHPQGPDPATRGTGLAPQLCPGSDVGPADTEGGLARINPRPEGSQAMRSKALWCSSRPLQDQSWARWQNILSQPDGHSGVFPTQTVLTVGNSIQSSSEQRPRAPSYHAHVFHFCQSCLHITLGCYCNW